MARIDLHQLDDFAVDFAPNKVGGSIPVWDGVNEQFTPLPYSVFGQNHEYDDYVATASTSSAVFQTYRTWDTSVIPVGVYRVFAAAVITTNSPTVYLELEVTADAVNVFPLNVYMGSGNATGQEPITRYAYLTVTSPKSVQFITKYRRATGGGGNSVTIYNMLLSLYRVS